jgi:glycerophosphoryl diester phosphodiesterase
MSQRSTPPLIVGHRGAPRERLENTLPSFERALSAGAEGIELDVQLTKDRQVVVMHDPDLGRVTGGRDRRRLLDLTLAEITALTLQAPAETEAAPLLTGRAPRLAEALDLIASFQACVAVEIKWDTGDPTAIVEAVARELTPARIARAALISFSRGVVRMVKNRRLIDAFGWIRSRPLEEEHREFLREIDPPMMVLKKTLATPEFLTEVVRPGREIWVYSLNDRADVDQFLPRPVRGYISDDPVELVRLRRSEQVL